MHIQKWPAGVSRERKVMVASAWVPYHLLSLSFWIALPSLQKLAKSELDSLPEYSFGEIVSTFYLSQHPCRCEGHKKTKAMSLCSRACRIVGKQHRTQNCARWRGAPRRLWDQGLSLSRGSQSLSVMAKSKCWWPAAHNLMKMGIRAGDGVSRALVSEAAAHRAAHWGVGRPC